MIFVHSKQPIYPSWAWNLVDTCIQASGLWWNVFNSESTAFLRNEIDNCRNDYVEACKELQGVVKAVYLNTSKPLQALIFEDILHAFRTLPQYRP